MTLTARPPFQRPMDRALTVDDHPAVLRCAVDDPSAGGRGQVVKAAGSLATATAQLNTQIAYDLTIAKTTVKAHVDMPVSPGRVWAASNAE